MGRDHRPDAGSHPSADDLKAHGLTLDWNPDRPVPGRETGQARGPCSADALVHGAREVELADPRGPRPAARRPHPRTVQRFRARMFLDLYWEIHEEWQRRLAADDSIDFEDMLVQAADAPRGRTRRHGLRPRAGRRVPGRQPGPRPARPRRSSTSPSRYLLAVGDDWQSINRFAGADLSVMTDFTDWFGEGPTLRLQTTFRSPQSICDTASEFVAKNPRQLTQDRHVDPARVRTASRHLSESAGTRRGPGSARQCLGGPGRSASDRARSSPAAPDRSRSTCSVATGSTATRCPDALRPELKVHVPHRPRLQGARSRLRRAPQRLVRNLRLPERGRRRPGPVARHGRGRPLSPTPRSGDCSTSRSPEPGGT